MNWTEISITAILDKNRTLCSMQHPSYVKYTSSATALYFSHHSWISFIKRVINETFRFSFHGQTIRSMSLISTFVPLPLPPLPGKSQTFFTTKMACQNLTTEVLPCQYKIVCTAVQAEYLGLVQNSAPAALSAFLLYSISA